MNILKLVIYWQHAILDSFLSFATRYNVLNATKNLCLTVFCAKSLQCIKILSRVCGCKSLFTIERVNNKVLRLQGRACNLIKWQHWPVVYFHQWTGALHALCWLKSCFSLFYHVFLSFSIFFHHKQKKEEKGKEWRKIWIKRDYQLVFSGNKTLD